MKQHNSLTCNNIINSAEVSNYGNKMIT